MINIVILAAGKGTRMLSNYPKVLAPIGGRPLLAHVIETATQLTKASPTVVIGHGADKIRQQFPQGIDYVEQREQLGTGHAVMQAINPQLLGHPVVVDITGLDDAVMTIQVTVARFFPAAVAVSVSRQAIVTGAVACGTVADTVFHTHQ